MKTHEFATSIFVPLPRERVFAFFSDAYNLEAITPPWLKFHVLTPRPIDLKPGAIIDYQLRLRGFPMRWRTEITRFEPPHLFADEQRRGPYRLWSHLHTFDEVAATSDRPAGTMVNDRVRYSHIGGSLVHRYLVRPDIERIFKYRQMKILELLVDKSPTSSAAGPDMLRACST